MSDTPETGSAGSLSHRERGGARGFALLFATPSPQPSFQFKSDVSDLDRFMITKPGNTRVWRGEGVSPSLRQILVSRTSERSE